VSERAGGASFYGFCLVSLFCKSCVHTVRDVVKEGERVVLPGGRSPKENEC
jgi:hypothetical protein